MSENSKSIAEEIYDALGTHKKFDSKLKREFAEALEVQLESAVNGALESFRTKATIEELESAVSDAEDAILRLNKLTHPSYSSEGFFCDGIARNSVNRQLKTEFGLSDVISYLDVFKTHLRQVHIPESKSGPNNIVSFEIAKFVAIKYKTFFDVAPSHNKNPDTPPSPFDRICDVIESRWKMRIAYSTRLQAVETAKAFQVDLFDHFSETHPVD